MNNYDLELYIHIPFCVRKCGYCDFLSFPAREALQREYLDKLTDEIRAQGSCLGDRRVTSIFLGGGTPSILPADWIGELFLTLQNSFSIAEDAEITIEANPGTLTMEKLEIYRESGINRLSLGLQSADDKELRLLGRIHTFDDFLKSYQRAREAGFTNINVDLMSALPGQDLHSWKSTLRKVLLLRPEHISAYSLIIEEGTPFYERYGAGAASAGRGGAGHRPVPGKNAEGMEETEKGADGAKGARAVQDIRGTRETREVRDAKGTRAAREIRTASGARAAREADDAFWPPLPDEDTDREMYRQTKEILAAQGYERYEISNYAKPGYECRHNCGYWTGVDYVGLGLGASSYLDGYRYRNVDDIREYLSLDLTEPGAAARDIHHQSLEEQMEEFMFLGLRMSKGVSGSEFFQRFDRNMWNVYEKPLAQLEAQQLIEIHYPQIRLTDRGVDVSNRVLSEFLLDYDE